MKNLVLIGLVVVAVGCGKDPKAKYKDTSVPALLGHLQDQDPGIRYWAAKELGQKGPQAREAVPALVEALKDEDKNVRAGVTYALAGIGPDAKPAVPALKDALKDPDEKVRKGAA